MSRPEQRRISRAAGTTSLLARQDRQIARLRLALEGMTKRLPTGVDGLESPICAYCRRDAKYDEQLRDYTADHAADCEWVAGRAALAAQGETDG